MASVPALDFTTLPDPPLLDQADFAACSSTIQVSVPGVSSVLTIYTEQVTKKDGKGSEPGVLFLHGMRFSSKNWMDIKSLYHVANWGFRAVAIDLPGFGKSTNTLGPEHDAVFLNAVIQTLNLGRPVIVSPSMSGGFSLPFLFGNKTESTEKALAYVPVAPVQTSKFVAEYKKSQLPTLIVCGTKDTMLGEMSNRDLGHLPKGQYAPIEGAGHACYLDNPNAFHRLLYHFLSSLI